jgi:hypothetical protein
VAGEVTDHIVVDAVGAPAVGAADREDPRVVGGIGQLLRPAAPVAGRDHHDDPLAPRHLRGVGEGVELVVLHAVGAEGQVEDPDVHARVVPVLHHPVDRGDDLRHIGGAIPVGDLHADDPGAGRHADEVVLDSLLDGQRGRIVAAGDDAGHVGAVPERVDVTSRVLLRLERQVRSVQDLARGAQSVDLGDAGVDHGDVDSLAGEAVVPVFPRAGDLLGDVVHRPEVLLGREAVVHTGEQAHPPVLGHGRDARRGPQLADPARRQIRGEPVDETEGPVHPTAQLGKPLLRGVPGAGQLPDDHLHHGLGPQCRRRR